VAPSDDTVLVTFDGNPPDLELYQHVPRRGGEPRTGMIMGTTHGFIVVADPRTEYRPVCEGPCTIEVPRGSYRLGVSRGGRRNIIELDEPVTITRPGALHAAYSPRMGLQLAGWATLGLGAAGGTGIAVSAGLGHDGGLAFAGVALAVTSLILGPILVLSGPTADIVFVPFGGPAAASGHEPLPAAVRTASVQGGALRIAF
jgi:hypothetical protein